MKVSVRVYWRTLRDLDAAFRSGAGMRVRGEMMCSSAASGEVLVGVY